VWVWRDETARGTQGSSGATAHARSAGASPGWRLDARGTWTWDEPSMLEREGVGVGALRYGFAAEPAPAPVPAARAAEPGIAGTPIFQALTADRSRRATLRAVPDDGWSDDRRAPVVPEPHPGSGPLPIQDARGPVRRSGLAEVPTVPPPPGPGEAADAVVAESPEDELRRRAERRRRPRQEPETRAAGGRHAMRAEAPAGGRHAMR
jgi:hypothetical protein